MSEKSYSNCPLKKRPVQVIHHTNFESDGENEEIRPVDLSVPRRYEPYPRRHSSDSEKQSPSTRLPEYVRIFSQPLSRSKFSYPDDSEYLNKSEDNLGSPVSIRGNSISPPVHHLDHNEPYHEIYVNHNNNIIKDETCRTNQRPMISPALSHLSYSSIQSDQHSSRYSEPEDLSVKIGSKTEHLNKSTDSNQTDLMVCESDRELYYQCAICKKCYSTAGGLIKHEQSHSLPQDLSKPKSSEYSVIMRTCDQTVVFNSKPHGTPRYQCSECGKSYSTYSGLTKHKEFHCPASEGNQSKKLFSCKNCDKVYVSLGALKMHIRTHTLPCKCPLCGKAFSRPWLLQGHIRTHTGEKPFTCQHCHRAFADRSNLRAHLQTHSDVKKYSCSSCSKTFSRMSLLGKHLQGGCIINSVNHRNENIQKNCDYSSITNQPMFYKSTASRSFPELHSLDFPVHENYADANRQQYEQDIHAF